MVATRARVGPYESLSLGSAGALIVLARFGLPSIIGWEILLINAQKPKAKNVKCPLKINEFDKKSSTSTKSPIPTS